MLLDAHVHLSDAEFRPYLPRILQSLSGMQLSVCAVSMDLDSSDQTLSLFSAQTSEFVKKFVGIHPEAAAREDSEKFAEFVESNAESIDGIGEIGLDPTYQERGSPYEKQKEVFQRMLSVAERFAKPLSIHSRKALDDVLATLPSFRLKGVLLHWFAGSKRQLERAMDLGIFVSYGPPLVYSKDKQVLLSNTHLDKFLIETDGPVRYSNCFGQYPALPTSFLISVAAAAAKELKLPYSDLASILEKNGARYLG